jgi:hypothetical protein
MWLYSNRFKIQIWTCRYHCYSQFTSFCHRFHHVDSYANKHLLYLVLLRTPIIVPERFYLPTLSHRQE